MKNRNLLIAVFVAGLLSATVHTAEVAPAPPPSAPAQSSATELEKLVAPIALYPDPLIAVMLPAAVYPLEIVQAARFVSNTNNLANLDAQPWDDNVKAVARVPAALQKMNDDLDWTMRLGEAFLAQDKEMLDTIQALRGKAQMAGTLKTTPQQVVVTNTVVEKTVETRVVVVTNTIVQIQPANPQVIYVPAYDPWYVYYPPPVYVGPPPVVSFAVGVTVGIILANSCDWHHGGIYVGHHGVAVWGGGGGHHGDVDIDIDRNVNIGEINVGGNGGGGRWQPDQNRLRTSGTSGGRAAASRTAEARGWGSAGARSSTGNTVGRPGLSPASLPKASSSTFSKPTFAPSPARDSAFGNFGSGTRERSFSSRGAASRGRSSGFAAQRGGGRRR